jgi:hypothetical protein
LLESCLTRPADPGALDRRYQSEMLISSHRSFRPARVALATATAAALTAALVALSPTEALACGGGVTSEGATMTVDQHVAFYSIRASGTTDVVVQLAVPASSGTFGVVLPVEGVPVLDDVPVETDELTRLDEATTPLLVEAEDGGGTSSGGCGCGSDADLAGGDDGGDGSRGVQVLDVAEIGPVTAVSFAADDPAALDTWLADNGFVVEAAARSLLDSYAVAGKTFIAFKRSDAAPEGPTAVGVHFTVPGAYQSYPLRLASLGAATEIGFRIYVANEGGALGPAAPFTTLGLDQLDRSFVRSDGYTAAVTRAVAERSGKAFVVEGVYSPSEAWRDALGPRLASMTGDDATLTRLTTIVDMHSLTEDVVFSESISNSFVNEIDLTTASLGSPRPRPVSWGAVGLFFGTVATSLTRRLRRRD